MLGTAIKAHIDSEGLKMKSVAEKADIPLNIFSAIVNEKRKITAEEYFAICAALNVPLEKFRHAGKSTAAVH